MPRVLVVDDSPVARKLLTEILSADPAITVIAEARDGVEAVALCKQLRPDLITMDIKMPNMDGIEATRQIMIEAATPVVIVSSLDPAAVRNTMNALEAGALAVLPKPSGPGSAGYDRAARELVATVKAMANVKVVRRWAATPPYITSRNPRITDALLEERANRIEVIGIAASTGGPNAIRRVLEALPAEFSTPILVVQHIAHGFVEGFGEWLRTTTKRDVRVATRGAPLSSGVVYVAPDDHHLEVASKHVVITESDPVDGFRPSGTRLFHSLATVFGPRAIGVILTGMGVDGVAGLRALRDAGGICYAQDEATCDVFGMPAAAIAAGIVEQGIPLLGIPGRLVRDTR